MARAAGWLGWSGGLLFGLPSGRLADGTRRAWSAWLALIGYGLLIRTVMLVLVVALALHWFVRASLPQLDGTVRVAGLSGAVRIERDALGIPTIHAETRADLALALGFLHAQERFFQMDGMRRFAAGELAELIGPPALGYDRGNRFHRLRAIAQRIVESADTPSRMELEAYVRGVNAGLEALGARPFEYLAFRQQPAPWKAEDSVLVVLSMFMSLQGRAMAFERGAAVAHATLPPALYELLQAPGDEWDAPLEGPAFSTPPLPAADVFDLRRDRMVLRDAPPDRGPWELPEVAGSNNWAVAGKHTVHGGAILANDMHLEIRVPNTWYRAAFAWPGSSTETRRAWGATLPGCPGLVVGSNGHVAWGLTNCECDLSDLIRLEIDPKDPTRYRTPDGWRSFEMHDEEIRVAGGPSEVQKVRATIWGPVLGDGYFKKHPHALRWAAYDSEVINLNLLNLLEANNVDEAVATATAAGGPHVNFLVADADGRIGWTIMGRVPHRVGFDGRVPVSWADGSCRWDGYYPPEKTPRIINPPEGRLWTANNRVVAGANLAMLGNGGYDRGARAGQIRDRLRGLDRVSEPDMLALQLDDRALFLERWQKLLLEVLRPEFVASNPALKPMRDLVADWGGRASKDSAGFRIVQDFRGATVHAILEPLTARCRREDRDFGVWQVRNAEGAVWRILQERPAHLLAPAYASFDALLQKMAKKVATELSAGNQDLALRTWGQVNTAHIIHPFSVVVKEQPRLRTVVDWWLDLDMPAEPLDGGRSDMPRVQGSAFGASQRMAVSPGRETFGYFHMPCGQSGHPLSPHYRDGHAAWAHGEPTPFLPGPTRHVLTLEPAS
jgi:penicillin amidase